VESQWEDINPHEQGWPRRRYYRMTQDGAERAPHEHPAQAPAPVHDLELNLDGALDCAPRCSDRSPASRALVVYRGERGSGHQR